MRYDFSAIEKRWQKVWLEENTYEPGFENPKKPFYNLMMFPYPSAEGLHVGNMYAFTGADIYGRMKRMQGCDVFEPIGLDGFGIHSENYALKVGTHPMDQAKKSQGNFYRQLRMIGNGFAWDEKLETYDPSYYRWTQWIFVQLWKHGLAYRKQQPVNWCPSCKTVLADEQVVGARLPTPGGVAADGQGRCERCGTLVEQRNLEQWFFRITTYAERLLENLESIDWSDRVKIAQRNWIGRSEGAEISFPLPLVPNPRDGKHALTIFTTRPDTLFGATFMVISPELARSWLDLGWKASDEVKRYVHEALARRNATEEEPRREKTGVFSGVYATNPANQEKIPVWVSDYVLSGYGTGAIMAVPAHDARDFEFARKFNLPVVSVVRPDALVPGGNIRVSAEFWEGDGEMINSGDFNGMRSEEARWKIAAFVRGGRKVQYRLRDWLVSRQRYWGPPIPMIHCAECAAAGKGEQKEMPGWYAVPEKELPVLLPRVDDFRPTGTGESPLASVRSFYETTCPGCGGAARRETDVSDTFLDSAWYYLRYPSTRSARAEKVPWDAAVTKAWLPVDLYTGGAEHSVLHLLYVRFLSLALHDMKLLEFGKSPAPAGEPFPKFRAHGLLVKEGAKMSKSKGNVVAPDEYIKKFGADTLRMYLMFLAPFEQGGDFRDASIVGIVRFLERVVALFSREPAGEKRGFETTTRAVHRTVKKVTNDVESLNYNTAIAALMVLLNELEAVPAVDRKHRETFLKLLAPFAPHLSEELWRNVLGHTDSIHRSPWPAFDEKLVVSGTVSIVVQVNGKLRATLSFSRGVSQRDVEAAAKNDPNVVKHLSAEPKKVVFVPDRLINFVV